MRLERMLEAVQRAFKTPETIGGFDRDVQPYAEGEDTELATFPQTGIAYECDDLKITSVREELAKMEGLSEPQ